MYCLFSNIFPTFQKCLTSSMQIKLFSKWETLLVCLRELGLDDRWRRWTTLLRRGCSCDVFQWVLLSFNIHFSPCLYSQPKPPSLSLEYNLSLHQAPSLFRHLHPSTSSLYPLSSSTLPRLLFSSSLLVYLMGEHLKVALSPSLQCAMVLKDLFLSLLSPTARSSTSTPNSPLSLLCLLFIKFPFGARESKGPRVPERGRVCACVCAHLHEKESKNTGRHVWLRDGEIGRNMWMKMKVNI